MQTHTALCLDFDVLADSGPAGDETGRYVLPSQ